MKGKHVPKVMREVIYSMHVEQGLSANDIYEFVFAHLNLQILQFERVQAICRLFDHGHIIEIQNYLGGEGKHSPGRPPLLTAQDSILLSRYLRRNKTAIINDLRNTLIDEFYEVNLAPSVSTIFRHIHQKLHFTHKVLERKNIHQDPVQQLQYLEDIAPMNPSYLIDIDGMVETEDDFLRKYGWSLEGEPAEAPQISLGGKTFAIHAAYSENGFIAYQIFEGSVSANEVAEFVGNTLRPFLLRNNFAILDNASNHKTAMVREVLEQAFRGQYYYCAPYSPELKPIERGFAMIKRYIRMHEAEGIADPIYRFT